MRSFSLKTFLAAVVFLALLLAYGTLQYRYWKLEAEVLQLRLEGGHLVPIDKRRVNVIQVPSSDPNLLRWRIYAPPGTEFDYRYGINGIPEEGLSYALALGGFEIESTENGILFTFEVTPSNEGGHDLVFMLGNHEFLRAGTDKPLSEWFDGGSYTSQTAGNSGAEAFDFDQPIVLVRRRMTDPKTRMTPKGDARGFMIWLIPRRKP